MVRSPHHSATIAWYLAFRTCPYTIAPEAAASWHARWPTPPEAPSINTLRPSNNPPWRNACKAVSPATGNVAACAFVTASGNTATEYFGTRIVSAHEPEGRSPTMRAFLEGPPPSG